MKRLLCIISCMDAGGAETFLMKIYRVIDRSKYQLDFAINDEKRGTYEDEITRLGGKIYRFPAKSESFFGYVNGLKKIVRDNHYEFALRITSNGMGFLDLAIAKMAGAKKCIARSSNSSDGGKICAFVAHVIGRFLFKRFVDVKIAPSREAAIYTFGKKDFNMGRVYVLPNGLDLNYYKYREIERLRVRKEFEIDENTNLLGHVGRFSRQKNHLFLIDIFSKYHKYNPKSKLMLVGEGELRNEICTKIKLLGLENFVIMTGLRSDLPALYSSMDVFLFPSFYEGMPNTVIEAQACGLKCIISDRITKEANITNNVIYLPIKENAIRVWIDEIVTGMNKSVDTCDIPAEYDIKNVVLKFQDLVFGMSNV